MRSSTAIESKRQASAQPAARAPLPPGPSAPALAQTILFHRDPLGALRRARNRFGDVFTLRLAIKGPQVIVSDPSAVGPLLRRDPGSAHAGEGRRLILPMASPRSVFGGDGADYEAAHRRLAAAFAPEAVAGLGPAIASIAERHTRRWPRRRPFRLLPRLRRLIDDAFVRLLLGVRDERRANEIARAIGRMLWTPGNPPVPVPGAGDGVAGAVGAAVFDRRMAPLGRLLAREVEERRSRPGDDADVIASMLRAEPGLSTEAIVDELIVVLAAAQEPPSIALSSLLDRLGRSPELVDRFLAEQPSSGFRDAVVRETMRLRPPAIAGLRTLTEPARVAGHLLPAEAAVMVPIPLLHRDPRVFDDPDRFEPRRWAAAERDERTYLPFGCGARRCIGEHLARTYFDAVVPAVLARLRLRPLSRQPERMVVRGTVLVPLRGGLVDAGAR